MNVSLHLSKLTFASGETLSLASDSIVLFVGAEQFRKNPVPQGSLESDHYSKSIPGPLNCWCDFAKNRHDFTIFGLYSTKLHYSGQQPDHVWSKYISAQRRQQ